MEKYINIIVTIAFYLLITVGCRPKEEPIPRVEFSGIVKSLDGKELGEAEVSIGMQSVKTGKDGRFVLKADSSGRYVLNISKNGFGIISKIYHTSITDKTYIMTPATIKQVDVSSPISVTDNRNKCFESNYSSVPTNPWSDTQVPVYNSTGELIGFGLPDELKQAMDKVRSSNTCNTGFRVNIPANALVDQNGNDASGEVNIAVTSIDLFSPDGMPGDYSAGERSTMISYGAGSVDIFSDGKTYQLKDGFEAEISIPVEPVMRDTEIPREIPFLVYNEEKGIWDRKGTGKLNEDGTAYIATTDHLSVFNMDVLKTDPACVRFCLDVSGANYDLRVVVPLEGGGVKQRTIAVDDAAAGSCQPSPMPAQCGGDYLHVLYNLPYDTPIAIEVLDGGAVFRTFVVTTNGAADLTGGTGNIPPCDYSGCCPGGDCGDEILVIGKPAMEDEKDPVLAIPEVLSCTSGVTTVKISWYFNGASGVAASDFSFAMDIDCANTGDQPADWIGFNGTVTTPININAGAVDISNAPIYSAELEVNDINYFYIKVRYDPDPTKISECQGFDLSGC